jgi:hypothetical protein
MAAEEIAFIRGKTAKLSLANAHAVFARLCEPKTEIFVTAAAAREFNIGPFCNGSRANDHEILEMS